MTMATTIDAGDPLRDIRDYALKMAERAGCGDPAEWAARAGVPENVVRAFVEGGDLGLSDFVRMCGAVDAFVLPLPESKEDEAVMLLEDERFYAEGVAPSPFDRYRDL
jgi:hypothetical protein